MGRTCSVYMHPQRSSIEKDIIRGVSNKEIAKKYSGTAGIISPSGVSRYKNERMAKILSHAQLDTVDGLVGRINDYMDTVEDLRDSILKILEDPENPGHICYYPKATEIKVKYYNDKTEKYAIGELQDLIEEVGKRHENYNVKSVYVEGSDPRITLLRVSDILVKHLELLCKAKGYISEENNITINAEASGDVEEFVNIARTALAPYPEASEAFVNALLEAADKGDRELAMLSEKQGEHAS